MRAFPLPEKTEKLLRENGESGSFWEDRKDRHHCGIDLYAPEGEPVIAIEDGEVIDVDIMTSPEMISYWNETYHIIIRNHSGLFCKYGELGSPNVKTGDIVEAGQVIGHVGTVLNNKKIDGNAPEYIQKLKDNNPSMLHFELWEGEPVVEGRNYLGGNWFGDELPEKLLDPTEYLRSIKSNENK
ncbi:M23 family metallopeptidase [Methanococcoides methylutens]|nr:M23 family metallopeptidase [Methanococcoides methylutens]